ncbi:MAG: cell division protein FtsX [Acetobacteraceae bacterium]|nr:cell division protein FtsX [Acetobacteraceae bacterium]
MTNKRRDDLGLRRLLGQEMLPWLVAAMAFLAALSIGGAMEAQAVSWHWQAGAARSATVLVPNPDLPLARQGDGPETTRFDAVLRALRPNQHLAQVRPLGPEEIGRLLRPWLGAATDPRNLHLPGVIALRLDNDSVDLGKLNMDVAAVAPGASVEGHNAWIGRLLNLASTLEACAFAVLALVTLVAVAVVVAATRSGLAARRETIDIVHGLGAPDRYIAARFARRIAASAGLGGLLGTLAALPVLFGLAVLSAPFLDGGGMAVPHRLADVPPLLAAVPALPVVTALLSYLTAQSTVRRWLRSLP